MNIKEATELWVSRDMTRIPLSVIEKLNKISDYNDIVEITPIAKYSRVWSEEYRTEGEVIGITEDDNGNLTATVELDNGEQRDMAIEDLSALYEDGLPMWGTMWTFDDPCDCDWLADEDNLRKMAECGFRIYESEDYGYIFGIDGCGYSFFDEHWIPLYKARRLRWHDGEDTEYLK